MTKPIRGRNGNFVRHTPVNVLKHHVRSRRLAVPIILAAVGFGVFVVFQSMASTRAFTRMECLGTERKGYATAEDCYLGSAEGVASKYFITIFGRRPNVDSLKFWSNTLSGLSTPAEYRLAVKMLDSTEAKRKFTALPSDKDKIEYLYFNALGRKPDPAGLNYWSARAKREKNWAKIVTLFISRPEVARKIRPEVLISVNALPMNWWPTRVPASVSPRGVYSGWNWNASASGYKSFEHSLVVDSYKPGSSYFWSHQFGFVGGDGGYIGLQSTGAAGRRSGEYRKTAIFSIFKAAIATDTPGCTISYDTFDGAPGSGTSCIITYNWVKGRTYKLRTEMGAREANGTWWSGWVVDTTSGAKTLIGRIKVPATWKGHRNNSVMWTENFFSTARTCNDIPYSKVRFSKPIADSSIRPIGSSQTLSNTYQCNNSRITPRGDGVTQEVGRSR